MGHKIELIPFLGDVVERNTLYFKEDFLQDAQKLRDAVQSGNMDERTFYFMSRPNGTWCVLERDAFLRDSDGFKIWTHYANQPDGIEAYRVTITGHTGEHDDVPLGSAVKLNYREQVQRVLQKAVPVETVELTFFSQERLSLPFEEYMKNQRQIFCDYGVTQNVRNIPKSEAELYRVISMEHRYQKGWRPRKAHKNRSSPERR